MTSIRRFEDLDCWKKSRMLCHEIHKVTLNKHFAKDYSFKDQILRSSGSVMDNIAEGFERGGNREFIQFLYIAKSSCAEVKSQLFRAKDMSYISENEFEQVYSLTIEVSKLLNGLLNYLNTSSRKGNKYEIGL